jgi:flagella basal body P-ring formation protein FlgA
VIFVRLTLAVLLAAASMRLAWSQEQDLGELQRAAEAYARSQTADLPGRVEITVAALDPRIRLARCESLQPFLAPGARLWGSSNVGMRCLKPESWTVYVPVAVKVTGEVVVTARPVRRGQVLEHDDIRLESAELTQMPRDVLTELAQAVGKSPNAAFPAGFALRVDMLRAPLAVTAGQRVVIRFQGEGFSVTSEGKSLGNASVGEAVQVRSASGKLLSGVVQEPGVVQVR